MRVAPTVDLQPGVSRHPRGTVISETEAGLRLPVPALPSLYLGVGQAFQIFPPSYEPRRVGCPLPSTAVVATVRTSRRRALLWSGRPLVLLAIYGGLLCGGPWRR